MSGAKRAVAAAAAVLLLAACGDSGGSGAGASAGDEVGANGDSTPGAGGEPDVGGVAGGMFAGDCDDGLTAFFSVHNEYLESIRAAAADGPIDYDTVIEKINVFVEAPPAEIRDDVQTYADELTPFLQGLAELGYNPSSPGDADADQYGALADELDSEAVSDAYDTIRAWFADECRAE